MLSRSEIASLVAGCESDVEAPAMAEMAIPSYLHGNPFVRWIIRRRLEEVEAIAGQVSARRILDFGCGIGLLGHSLHDSVDDIFLCDIELGPARMLVQANNLKKATLLGPDEVESSIPDGTLDLVVAADVLEHFPSDQALAATCSAFAQKLGPSGALLVSGPTESLVYRIARKVAGFSGDYHHRDVFDIERLLVAQGWRRHRLIKLPRWSPLPLFRVTQWHPPERGPR